MASLTADIAGLIDAFGEDSAILIGHDWGSPICWNTASFYLERVSAIGILSVPYHRRRTSLKRNCGAASTVTTSSTSSTFRPKASRKPSWNLTYGLRCAGFTSPCPVTILCRIAGSTARRAHAYSTRSSTPPPFPTG
jgi:pimeloyl-ACP methyl ester carboxylesterase